jgi:hypothetical protein
MFNYQKGLPPHQLWDYCHVFKIKYLQYIKYE